MKHSLRTAGIVLAVLVLSSVGVSWAVAAPGRAPVTGGAPQVGRSTSDRPVHPIYPPIVTPEPEPPATVPPADTPVASVPGQITLDHNGSTIKLDVGATFVLNLQGGALWSVSVDDTSVLAMQSPTPGQGTYVARAAGTTALHAIGSLPCRQTHPACAAPDRSFSITVVVAPVAPPVAADLSLITGTVVQVQDGAVLIEPSGARTTCPPGHLCTQVIEPRQRILIHLADTAFNGSLGESVGRPALKPGDLVVAAGTFLPNLSADAGTGIQAEFKAKVASVLTTAPIGVPQCRSVMGTVCPDARQ